MEISSLSLDGVRNLTALHLSEFKKINILYGDNGSGKTSFLESIYCLGYGRSFRTHQARQMIQAGKDAFTVFAEVKSEYLNHRVGLRRDRQGVTEVRIDGNNKTKFSELARCVPIQLITPESIGLIVEGPRARRQYMDWGLFHVEQSGFQECQKYERLLKHRNALLRKGLYFSDGGAYWDSQLAEAGEQLTASRKAYLKALNGFVNKYCQIFLPDKEFKFRLQPGWQQKDLTLKETLEAKLDTDLKQGFTSVGPSKAEWQIRVDGADAKERLSRGQLKLLTAALRIVQGEHYKATLGTSCIYLVDDLPAELDEENQGKLCEVFLNTNSQVFITAINKNSLLEKFNVENTELFHVEQGRISKAKTG